MFIIHHGKCSKGAYPAKKIFKICNQPHKTTNYFVKNLVQPIISQHPKDIDMILLYIFPMKNRLFKRFFFTKNFISNRNMEFCQLQPLLEP